MTYSGDEIEALAQRLTKLERASEELQTKDLLVAKELGVALCNADYRTALLYLTGEEVKAFRELWSEKLEATVRELKAAEAVEGVFEIMRKFAIELAEYMRAEKVKTAEEAMDIAHGFIKKYTGFALPMKALKEGDVWLVDIDVGALATKIAKVKVDAKTGDILSYEIPEK